MKDCLERLGSPRTCDYQFCCYFLTPEGDTVSVAGEHNGFSVSAVISKPYFLFCAVVILVHASLRLRNLKNKIENKMESIGLKRTPMGLLLEALGQEQEAGS